MNRKVLESPWMRAGAMLAALAATALAIYLLRAVLVPLLFAFLVAYILHPVADTLERRRIPRMPAVIVIVVALMLGFLLLPLMILPGIVVEAQKLVEAAKQDFSMLWFDRLLDRLPLTAIMEQIGWIPEGAQDVNERAVLAERLGAFIQTQARAFLVENLGSIAGAGQRVTVTAAAFFASLASGILNTVLFIGNFALFAFVAIYLLKDFDRIAAAAHELLPPRHRGKITDIVIQIDIQLRAYLRGQITVCCCLAAIYAVGFRLAGVPFAFPLALIGGLANLVPYLGVAITIGPVLLLTLLQHGFGASLIGALLVFLLAQLLESYVLTPRIVGGQVGLSPVWVILAIMVFSTTLGFVGLLLAVPLAATLKVLVLEGLEAYRRSAFFVGEASDGGA